MAHHTTTTLNYPGYPAINVELVTETTTCEACDGKGWDWGDKWDYTPCPECNGDKMITIERNYLGEALHIAAGRTTMKPEVKHLQAIVTHARDLVSAAFSLPEIPREIPRKPTTPETEIVLGHAATEARVAAGANPWTGQFEEKEVA